MNLFELLIITLIASICTAFGYVWGAIMTIAKQEDETVHQYNKQFRYKNGHKNLNL